MTQPAGIGGQCWPAPGPGDVRDVPRAAVEHVGISDGAPRAGHGIVAVEDVLAGQPVGQSLALGRSPLTLLYPPREFGERDELDKGARPPSRRSTSGGSLPFRLGDATSVSSTTGPEVTGCRCAVQCR